MAMVAMAAIAMATRRANRWRRRRRPTTIANIAVIIDSAAMAVDECVVQPNIFFPEPSDDGSSSPSRSANMGWGLA